jgi:cell division transport system permease protein
MAGRSRRRRYSRDPLGLRRALADRLLPGLVAAMALLAALAIAGSRGAAELAERWRAGAAAAVTVQLPPEGAGDRERLDRALAALREMPEVAEARAVDPARLRALLRPWLGEAPPALPLPAVIEVRLAQLDADPARLADRLAEAVPGAVAEAHGVWVARLVALAAALRGVALAVLALVAGVAAAVIGVATRAGLAARRESILILHGLGATDSDIAGRFARRAALLAGAGGLIGAAVAVPVLAGLWALAGPLLGGTGTAAAGPRAGGGAFAWAAGVPWLSLAAVPAIAWTIGWVTAQATVRRWLRHLP